MFIRRKQSSIDKKKERIRLKKQDLSIVMENPISIVTKKIDGCMTAVLLGKMLEDIKKIYSQIPNL